MAPDSNPLNDYLTWSNAKGTHRGQVIEPLYKTIPQIVQDDELFYELLTIIDTIRIGRVREVKIAIDELNKRLKDA